MINADILLDLASRSDNPLSFVLRSYPFVASWKEQADFLIEGVGRYGGICDEKVARQILRLAESLPLDRQEECAGFIERLRNHGNPASMWMAAAIFESKKRHYDAAILLKNISDENKGEGRGFRLLTQARYFIKSEAWEEGWTALRETVSVTESFQTLCSADNLLERIRKSGTVTFNRKCRIGVVGSTTLDLLIPALRVQCAVAGIEAEIYCGSFDQYRQEILDPQSALSEFTPDVVIIVTDWRAMGLQDETENTEDIVNLRLSELQDLWKQCRDRWGAFVIQHNFEIPPYDPYGSLSVSMSRGRGRVLRMLNLRLWEVSEKEAGVVILDVDQIAALFGKTEWSDPIPWHTAKQYPTATAIPVLTRHHVSLIRAFLGLTEKCLVMDLDNTLWGGVIGEDGLTGIELGGTPAGEAFRDFQRYLKSMRHRGIILAVCSKNDEQEALRPFKEHREMVLSLEDITLFVANWRPKDENIRMIAKSLNIGLDSIVFLDDNPVERDWVRQQIPEIKVPEIPSEPARYIQVIERGMYFEALSLTDEDRRRIDTYRENAQRTMLLENSHSLEAFLADLQMHIQLLPFNDLDLPRITQLINKTNQFNLTTRRLSETFIRNLINNADCYTQAMRLRDRFGDSGLVGVLIGYIEDDHLRIDTWLMSCRILGRRVEEVMLDAAMQYARREGLQGIIGEYIPTSKNGQVRDLYERLGFEFIEKKDDCSRYRWELARRYGPVPGWFQIDDQTHDMKKMCPS